MIGTCGSTPQFFASIDGHTHIAWTGIKAAKIISWVRCKAPKNYALYLDQQNVGHSGDWDEQKRTEYLQRMVRELAELVEYERELAKRDLDARVEQLEKHVAHLWNQPPAPGPGFLEAATEFQKLTSQE
ncbi:hypothetical protein HKX48_003009 [Thoreauomyces humboldtii]|nr:hypothetical protein HKX48_003009 [Thoreauomyces humboldtii]